jgi:hypothetical protein
LHHFVLIFGFKYNFGREKKRKENTAVMLRLGFAQLNSLAGVLADAGAAALLVAVSMRLCSQMLAPTHGLHCLPPHGLASLWENLAFFFAVSSRCFLPPDVDMFFIKWERRENRL